MINEITCRMQYSNCYKVYNYLHDMKFPFREISQHPISSIELMTVSRDGKGHGVCSIGCIACCADAVHPKDTKNLVNILSIKQFSAFLAFSGELADRGLELLSLGRLNLFSASNELDHAHANDFRRLLSDYLVERYEKPLGCLASDLVFHVSTSKIFLKNLQRAIEYQPTLWDNICIAIDEQIPFKNKNHFIKYTAAIGEVWGVLSPALTSELDHAKDNRRGQPRVIINFLVPDAGDSFRDEYRYLYPGGPPRATHNEELIQRYVKPYVGNLIALDDELPLGHSYTTGVSRLSNIHNSKVFVSASKYANQGRAKQLINFHTRDKQKIHPYIHTKLLPLDGCRFQIRAFYSSGFAAEDELDDCAISTPEWMTRINETIIDLGS